MAEYDAKDVGPPPLAVAAMDERSLAEIDLCFLAGTALQTPKRQGRRRTQLRHEAPHAVVLVGKAVFADEVLPDALGAESLIEFGQNDVAKQRAVARLTAARGGCR
jgi:hypothetical protein